MRIFIEHIDTKFPVLDLVTGKNRFNEGSTENILEKFLVKSRSDADVILIAHDAIHFAQNKSALEKIRMLALDKPLIISDCGDFPKNLKLDNVFSLRTNFPPFQSYSNAIAIPYNVKSRKNLEFRNFHSVPFISFVGYMPKVFSRRILPKNLEHLKHPFQYNGALVRYFGLNKIDHLPNAMVIKRVHYGGARSLINNIEKFEEDFEFSIRDSDLVFCPRGDANQSARYYEVLSSGRIPIIPETQIIFPRIWDSHEKVIQIEVDTLSRKLEEKVNRFWSGLTPKTYEEIQLFNRSVFSKIYDYKKFLSRLFEADIYDLENFLV